MHYSSRNKVFSLKLVERKKIWHRGKKLDFSYLFACLFFNEKYSEYYDHWSICAVIISMQKPVFTITHEHCCPQIHTFNKFLCGNILPKTEGSFCMQFSHLYKNLAQIKSFWTKIYLFWGKMNLQSETLGSKLGLLKSSGVKTPYSWVKWNPFTS